MLKDEQAFVRRIKEGGNSGEKGGKKDMLAKRNRILHGDKAGGMWGSNVKHVYAEMLFQQLAKVVGGWNPGRARSRFLCY